MQLFYHEKSLDSTFELDQEESRHLIKVLRKTKGDQVQFTDGKGCLVHGAILDADPKRAKIIVEQRLYQPQDDFYIHLAICPTKNLDRMEWMLEKITEIGVHEISFIESKHSERVFLKMDRLEKKMIAACKQSLKFHFPILNGLRPLEEILKESRLDSYQRFIAYLDEDNTRHLYEKAEPNQSYIVLIGPEGDFSKEEVAMAFDYHFLPCSLGRSRLRTETAGVAAVHSLQLKNTLIIP
ncbi:16S rRNA (uracil(1498)-N(3))-methyltransferase [Mongoliitalea daihaiensis]|uniref:16S rRNA (uracil(1498)-N(3))-methyltransferase n=1 Tax=Mongoliitalea daihaiensis TaxID=2782006 RepID=UPI001F1E2969|nr:16S rRNA (uracil(1498)-N(3))-methyltransferase [Mongoliitalea daihaiensis]UJP63488.1 16S rRNA (uracil(1498)-N(3))-methyltransferase [Mongoliitalea daihaiensis]